MSKNFPNLGREMNIQIMTLPMTPVEISPTWLTKGLGGHRSNMASKQKGGPTHSTPTAAGAPLQRKTRD